jgi:hypothetical protein
VYGYKLFVYRVFAVEHQQRVTIFCMKMSDMANDGNEVPVPGTVLAETRRKDADVGPVRVLYAGIAMCSAAHVLWRMPVVVSYDYGRVVSLLIFASMVCEADCNGVGMGRGLRCPLCLQRSGRARAVAV